MKNIFIGGVAKSGKSTFSEKISSKNYNHIPVDYFTASLKRNFKETNISSSVIIGESSSKISLLLSTVIEIIDSKDDEYFILDSAHVMPKDIMKYIDRDKWDVYFFGYPNIDAKEKFDLIRKYEKGGWTKKRSDEELLDTIEKLIEISKEIESQCTELNIKFIDTSSNFEDKLKEFTF